MNKKEMDYYFKEFMSDFGKNQLKTIIKIGHIEGEITDLSIMVDQMIFPLVKDMAELRAKIWRLEHR